MNDLPWLVVHGREVWMAALLGLPALGAAFALAAVVLGVVRRVLSVRRAFGAPVGAGMREDGARVTLSGRVVGASRRAATTVLRAGHAPVVASFGAEDLALEVDGEVIAIQGAPRVRVGSAESGPRRFGGHPASVREQLVLGSVDVMPVAAADASIAVWSLAADDRVLARGVLRRIPSGEVGHSPADRGVAPAGYRRALASWALAIDGSRAGEGIAFSGAPPLAARSIRAARAGVIGGLAVFGVVFILGGLAVRGRASVLAAATPLHRERALRELGAALGRTAHHDARLVDQEAALAALRGDLVREQDALLRHRQLRRAASVGSAARSADTEIGAANALAELGEYEEAARRLALVRATHADVADAVLFLVGGRPDRAARTCRALARAGHLPLRGGRPPTPYPHDALRAVADALDARFEGDRDALERLRAQEAADPGDRAPHLLLADLLSGEERAHVLRSYAGHGVPLRAAMSIERLLAHEIGDIGGRDWARLVYPVWLAYGREEGHLWEFMPAHFEREDALRPGGRARIEAAYVASALGDHAQAVALHVRETDGGASLDTAGSDALHLAQVIEGRAGVTDPLPDSQGVWLALPLIQWLQRGGMVPSPPPTPPLLADVLDEAPADADQAYLVANQAEPRDLPGLRAWFRYGVVEHRSRTRLGRLGELENLRLLAAAVGDTDAAAELGAIVARHRAALTNRAILVPLAILEEIVLDGHAEPELWR
jgi:hypothetical protein